LVTIVPGGNAVPDPAPAPTSIEKPRVAALAAMTVVGLVLCGLVAYPFLPALAWAVALAVMALPMHTRLAKVIRHGPTAAAVSTVVVVALILVPVLAVGGQLAREATGAAERAREMAKAGKVDEVVEKVPNGPWVRDWVRRNVDVEAETRRVAGRLVGDVAFVAQGTVGAVLQFLVCVFVLFYALLDRGQLLESARGLAPLSRAESEYLFTRVADSIHATVYATIVTSLMQGVTGGLLWWWLGLPAPVLWGTVMFILGVLPIAGAGLVWVPAAAWLAFEDRFAAAAVMAAWGVLVTGVVGNYAYGYLAGERLRLHPVPVMIAFVGGLAVFGLSGMVVGPVVLAVTLGLLDVWRQRLRGDAAGGLRAA
jgi:predicted PurR-regulated permease PerM